MIKIKLIENLFNNHCWIYITGAEAISRQLQINGYDREDDGWGKTVCNDDAIIRDEVELVISMGAAVESDGKKVIAEVIKVKEFG